MGLRIAASVFRIAGDIAIVSNRFTLLICLVLFKGSLRVFTDIFSDMVDSALVDRYNTSIAG